MQQLVDDGGLRLAGCVPQPPDPGGNTDFWVLGFWITMTFTCVCVCVHHRVDSGFFTTPQFQIPRFLGCTRACVHGCYVEEMLCVGGWGI